MNFDITFCSKNNCPNRECERNQVNLNELDYKINHKWTGSLGIITEIKDCKENGTRYMVGLPSPEGTAYIFVMSTENAIEKIGKAILIPS